MPDQKTVVVTGFGPFAEHRVNASWAAVQEMSKLDLPDYLSVIPVEMPVEYKAVDEIVPLIWARYKPDLVIHIGVSSIAAELTLEQQGHNNGYDKLDISSMLPKAPVCKENGPDCILSRIDMSRVCRDINSSDCNVKAVVSYCAGRYLCGYAYYTSLYQNPTCSAFIHVPPLGGPYSAQQLALGIREALLSMLKQISPEDS
ncbi:putative pyroglutamyl-peptidase 1 [Apostichopus japonicus]|uniref:Putative pyroglutamyl-peptidase 1 n=1 Tax=Stichopus japonicus TaxID=307972 RepID=A0A2G8KPX1_STIJA|nr:putative pyroglutamyl-peptidase 1 [Apostichopus japonicus]